MNQRNLSTISIIFMTAAALTTLSACSDPYAEPFTKISVGDSRAQVISTMGTPTTEQRIEVPLVNGAQLTWKAQFTSKTYQVVIIVDHVAMKTVVN